MKSLTTKLSLAVAVCTFALGGAAARAQSDEEKAASEEKAAGEEKAAAEEKSPEAKADEMPQMGTVLFEYDSAELTPAAHETLAKVATWACKNKGEHITIEGHADEIGATDYNTELAARRAAAVREALTAVGLDPGRVEIIVYGQLKPAADEPKTIDAQEPNRRVVLYRGSVVP